MYDRELDQRLHAMHDRGVHRRDRVLRLSYDPGTAGALRAAGLGPVQVRLTVMRAVPDVSPILLERSVARCAEASDRPG